MRFPNATSRKDLTSIYSANLLEDKRELGYQISNYLFSKLGYEKLISVSPNKNTRIWFAVNSGWSVDDVYRYVTQFLTGTCYPIFISTHASTKKAKPFGKYLGNTAHTVISNSYEARDPQYASFKLKVIFNVFSRYAFNFTIVLES